MNNQIRNNACETCRECCCYADYKGNEFTLSEMEHYFSFPEHLCETFFRKNPKNQKYKIGDYCDKYTGSRCAVYHRIDFPFVCAAYPFFLITTERGKLELAIDKNCRQWRVFLNSAEQITSLIAHFHQENRKIDTFIERDMRRMGYKLHLLEKEIELP